MMKQHGPWQIRGTQEIYRDPWIEVQRDDVIRPDGRDGTHCVVRMKPGVSVLPVDDAGYVYLTDEFHYGVGRDSIEVVSGGIEPGEDRLLTAQRELEEELGIRAQQWDFLGSVDPFTTIIVSPTALFLARQLTFGATAQEGTEQIRTVKMPFSEAVRQVIEGQITHAPSCVLILKAQALLQGENSTTVG
ncbi:MAG: NUDIX hydrolase [Planctomycetales bacterium]|nr:NUDIX hydrolase [Planctomycetales bacterium]